MSRRWTGVARRVARWVLTAVAVGVILSRTEIGGVVATLRAVSAGWICLAVGLYIIDRLLGTFKWRLLFEAHGERLPMGRAFGIYLESAFWGAALPATIGMDLVRSRLASRTAGSFSHALSSVIVERFLGIAGLLLCAVLGLWWFAPGSVFGFAVPLIVSVGAVLGISLLIVAAVRPPPTRAGRGVAAKLWRAGASVLEWLRGFRRYPASLAGAAGIAFAQQYLLTAITWILALGLGLRIELTTMLWVWPVIMSVIRLPVSVMGFGVRELLLLQLLEGIVSEEASVALGLLSGGLDLAFIAVGGLLAVWGRTDRPVPKRENAKPSSPGTDDEKSPD
jgi:uncharacterized membrane protein YbhN (UPF0104 family)